MPVLNRMRGAKAPIPPQDMVADLVELHAERPGITEQTLGAFATVDGKTGYHLLADLVPADARHVLELACGNGPLLELLLAMKPALNVVTGVDACAPELARARSRLPDPRLDLRCENAQHLSLPDASVDVILSHHGFYLFDPVEPVVRQMARVLKPGGLFAFMTAVPAPGTCVLYMDLLRHFGQITLRENPFFKGWGDKRVWDLDALTSLLVAGGFEQPLKLEQFILHLTEGPSLMCDRLMRFFYSVDLLSVAAQQELRTAWVEMMRQRADRTGRVRMEFPATRISTRRL